MNFKEYTKRSKETLTYNTYQKLISCCTMEIMGELTEYLEASESISATDEQLQKELGDICYSLAILPDYFGIEVEKITAPYMTNTAQRYFSLPNLTDDGLFCLGKAQEVIKKVIRDDNWELTNDERRARLTYYFCSMYSYIVEECKVMGWNLSDILVMNVEKLQSRKNRNVLLGDGDER